MSIGYSEGNNKERVPNKYDILYITNLDETSKKILSKTLGIEKISNDTFAKK